MIYFLDLTLATLEENLALDEALLLAAESAGAPEVLRLWEWTTPAVVLGAGCRITEDVKEAACRQYEVPIRRRSSGGGTVLLNQGCLLFTLVLAYDRAPELRGITSSYCYILGKMLRSLDGLVPGMTCAGISDLAIEGRKFSGNAQQRKRRHLLHHGTLLYAFEASMAERCLAIPLRQPAYRELRDHSQFLGNVGANARELRERLQTSWNAHIVLENRPAKLVEELVQDKYSQTAWIRRR